MANVQVETKLAPIVLFIYKRLERTKNIVLELILLYF